MTERVTLGEILTSGGRKVKPMDLKPSDLDMFDIAHSLSMTCRFGGHSSSFYSVAQHSVLVSELVIPDLALAGILHDVSEAYIGDIPAPLKRSDTFEPYRVVEAQIEAMIEGCFYLSLTPTDRFLIKKADKMAMAWEGHNLFRDTGSWLSNPIPDREWYAQNPEEAKDSFLKRYEQVRPKLRQGGD